MNQPQCSLSRLSLNMSMAFLRRNKKVISSMRFIRMSNITMVKAILNTELVRNLTITSERQERLTYMAGHYLITLITTKRSCFMIIHLTMLRLWVYKHTQLLCMLSIPHLLDQLLSISCPQLRLIPAQRELTMPLCPHTHTLNLQRPMFPPLQSTTNRCLVDIVLTPMACISNTKTSMDSSMRRSKKT